MRVIEARNVNHALHDGMRLLADHGLRRESRNGPVVVMPCPVTTVYRRPLERVLFSKERDANPFFHLVEALWMLAGRDDLATLTKYVARMSGFSDDGGVTQPGAYGKRWRRHFMIDQDDGHATLSYPFNYRDQLLWAIRRLVADPNDRRVVIQMYDADMDQDAADEGGKDVPCNLACAPWVDTDGRLSMTVFCRSNDAIWGAHGANAVHFAFLQEYLAAGVGVPVGRLYQVSNNYHAYEATLEPLVSAVQGNLLLLIDDRYDTWLAPVPLVELAADTARALRELDEDLTIFFDEPAAPGLRTAFLRQVACPMVLAHQAYRRKQDPMRFAIALEVMDQCRAGDWRVAGREWLMRREIEANRKVVT